MEELESWKLPELEGLRLKDKLIEIAPRQRLRTLVLPQLECKFSSIVTPSAPKSTAPQGSFCQPQRVSVKKYSPNFDLPHYLLCLPTIAAFRLPPSPPLVLRSPPRVRHGSVVIRNSQNTLCSSFPRCDVESELGLLGCVERACTYTPSLGCDWKNTKVQTQPL